jgi:hypothetical protein
LLVGGFKHFFIFPFHIWDVILPIDELHHFSRWLKPRFNKSGALQFLAMLIYVDSENDDRSISHPQVLPNPFHPCFWFTDGCHL